MQRKINMKMRTHLWSVSHINSSDFFLSSPNMSTVSAASVEPAAASTEQKKPLKPCCACPETKKVRDAWWVPGQRLTLFPCFKWKYLPVLHCLFPPASLRKERKTARSWSRRTKTAWGRLDSRFNSFCVRVCGKYEKNSVWHVFKNILLASYQLICHSSSCAVSFVPFRSESTRLGHYCMRHNY